nr:MAG TPA: hypothetical protein [Caudoviricetes sp.]
MQLQLNYLKFSLHERKGQKLAPIHISNKSFDTKYRKEAEDSQNLAYFYIENI